MFGRKRSNKADLAEKLAEDELEAVDVDSDSELDGDAEAADRDSARSTEEGVDEDAVEDDVDDVDDVEDVEDDEDEEPAEPDWRADGPFDYDEVDLQGDEVTRIDLETLIVTPWEGMELQLQVEEQSRQVLAVTGVWQDSGLEVVLYAAPSSGGLAEELIEEAANEVTAAGGTAELTDGPFGPEARRVLPQQRGKGEQLYHVSRVWCAQGPRWVLRATLLGEAALAEDDDKAAPFLEFFRNLVVRRGAKPMVPGERISMKLPEQES